MTTHSSAAATSDLLADLLTQAEGDLVAATNGSSLCAVGRSATTPAVKYAEGRWVALRDVARGADGRDGTPADALSRVSAEWARRGASVRTRTAGEAWLAYTTGGTDALDGLRRALTEVAGDAH